MTQLGDSNTPADFSEVTEQGTPVATESYVDDEIANLSASDAGALGEGWPDDSPSFGANVDLGGYNVDNVGSVILGPSSNVVLGWNTDDELTVDSPVIVNGSAAATESWVSSNFNDYTDSDAQNAVDGALISISGSASATESSLSSHENASNPHSGSASESWVSGNFNDYTDSDARSALDGSDPSFGTVSASAVNVSGDSVATESWVTSNYNNLTDSEVRDIISGSALSSGLALGGTLGLDGNGIEKVDSIDFGSSSTPVSIGYDSAGSALLVTGQIMMSGSAVATVNYVDNNFNNYTDSEARSAVDGANIDIGGDADSVDGYDIQKNGTDGSGIINFKT